MTETRPAPNFAKRRKIAAFACIAALIVLIMHSRCAPSDAAELPSTVTKKSQAVTIRDNGIYDSDSADSDAVDTNVVYAGWNSMQDGEDASATESTMPTERVLLIGFDGSNGEPGRTDGLVIAVFDYAQKQVGLISVPRDLWIDIPILGPGRINTVYRVGTRVLGREKGLALLRKVIFETLGLSVDYTVAVNYKGFVTAVDELGGINVDVKCPIEDCFWMNGDTETCVPLSLQAGTQHLNGQTALLYARSRHGRTDIDRGRRQQAVLMGLKNRLIRPTTLMGLPHLVSKLSPYVETNLPLDAVLRMAALTDAVKGQGIHGLVMKPPIVEGETFEDGKSVLQLNKAQWRAALSKLFEAAPPGAKDRGVCPTADIGLNWRDRLQKNKKTSKSSSSQSTDN
jgi:LCP family protein required for cell wall assembly